MTAKCASANTDTAANLCLVPDTNLAQLDTGAEHASQIFYQLTEINSSICSKIEKKFIVIKGILCRNQLHFQTMFRNLLQTDTVGLLFLLSVFHLCFFILLCRRTNDFF